MQTSVLTAFNFFPCTIIDQCPKKATTGNCNRALDVQLSGFHNSKSKRAHLHIEILIKIDTKAFYSGINNRCAAGRPLGGEALLPWENDNTLYNKCDFQHQTPSGRERLAVFSFLFASVLFVSSSFKLASKVSIEQLRLSITRLIQDQEYSPFWLGAGDEYSRMSLVVIRKKGFEWTRQCELKKKILTANNKPPLKRPLALTPEKESRATAMGRKVREKNLNLHSLQATQTMTEVAAGECRRHDVPFSSQFRQNERVPVRRRSHSAGRSFCFLEKDKLGSVCLRFSDSAQQGAWPVDWMRLIMALFRLCAKPNS